MDISKFKDGFNGGTRANRFQVQGAIGLTDNATASNTQNYYKFHVRSTFIPPVTNITLEMHGYGRKLHIPGDRQYAPWQMTIYDDRSSGEGTSTATGTNLWKKFVDWQTKINQHDTNTTATSTPYLNYKNTWTIEHLDLNESVIKTFTLYGCWPKSVTDIDFNMTRRNFLNTFSVIMLYDSIEVEDINEP
jgi:hypothetical protein